jgi:hypothetical protein
MKSALRDVYTTLRTEGALLPPDLLQRVAEGDKNLGGLTPSDYHCEGEKLNEVASRAWQRLQGRWAAFEAQRDAMSPEDTGTTITRERWLLPLFQELGYGRLQTTSAIVIGDKDYPVSHLWASVPIHLVGCNVKLDTRTAGVAGAARRSPHSLVQELLNRSDDHLWAFASNGLQLRILHDNVSLSRQAYVEFDLEATMRGELYADFVLMWLLCHESRIEGDKAEDCWLERWSQEAQQQGLRALDGLRVGVTKAIVALGKGFLAHAANRDLLEKLRSGDLDNVEYYRQLLRLVYRLLFLFTAEDRDLLLLPMPDGSEDEAERVRAARERYLRFCSGARLRELAAKRRGSRHGDLYEGLEFVLRCLESDDGCPALALPALGSFLFSDEAMPDLAGCRLANSDLLESVRALAFAVDAGALRPIDFRNLGAEELGSVYESLLEMQPELNREAATFDLKVVSGSERKTTGSYYTPSSLIQCLLDSALDPVVDERLVAATKGLTGPGERRAASQAALLDLRMCDPACGSGHFLIAAAHRLARRLAAVRTGDDEPGPGATRQALRDVIGHCLYGVDINPMAVELCKVNLWMEALEPGKPLSFLDHRIQCGNSLLGATPALMRAGIPDEAFKSIDGDDIAYAAALRKRNKSERMPRDQVKGALGLFDGDSATDQEAAERLSSEALALDGLGDDSPIAVATKRARYKKLVSSDEHRAAKLLADLWCAAFVRVKTPGVPYPVTEEVFRRVEDDPSGISLGLTSEVRLVAERFGFFHWHVAFPDVCRPTPRTRAPENEVTGWDGGFDVMLGNPPWERVKLQQQEFFAERCPDIANAKNAAARNKMIGVLPESDPGLAAEWAAALRKSATESAFLRLSGRYPLGGVGDVNTYAVFADLFRQLINPRGSAALLLPNGLVTGFTYREFLRHLLRTRTLASFYGFENEDKIFPDVHNETKFGILTVHGSSRPVETPAFTAHLRQPSQTRDPLRRYGLTAKQIEAINPNTLNLPAFRWARDAEVAAAIHAAAPILVGRSEVGCAQNPWGISFRRMFDMANDSGLFIDHADVAPRIVERRSALAVLDDGTQVYPLYEGKMLWHFDHRYGTYEGQTEKQANKGVLPHVDDEVHDDPCYQIQPRYWVTANEVRKALGADADREWFFAWRDVGPTERTLVGTLVPCSAAGDQAPLATSTLRPQAVAALVAVLSSLVVDYDARQRSNRMKFFVAEQLAVLLPDVLAGHRAWLGSSAEEWLASRTLELSYTSIELEPFARDLGCNEPPFRWNAERRALLQAEIDAVVLHLYGLSRSQAEWLIDSFAVLRKYEERDQGEFRTKRLVLSVYDALTESRRDGTPHRTLVDPPPADKSCCHRATDKAASSA